MVLCFSATTSRASAGCSRPTTELQQTTWGRGRAERYTVPYLIWANDAAARKARTSLGEAHERTSLNYLGSRLVEARSPTTSYQRFLLAMRSRPRHQSERIPTADGIWHGFGNEEAAGCSTLQRTQPSSTTTSSTRTRPGR
ncbi:MAG: hypothetical protein ACLTMP_12315 [Eggerthella lenta]